MQMNIALGVRGLVRRDRSVFSFFFTLVLSCGLNDNNNDKRCLSAVLYASIMDRVRDTIFVHQRSIVVRSGLFNM